MKGIVLSTAAILLVAATAQAQEYSYPWVGFGECTALARLSADEHTLNGYPATDGSGFVYLEGQYTTTPNAEGEATALATDANQNLYQCNLHGVSTYDTDAGIRIWYNDVSLYDEWQGEALMVTPYENPQTPGSIAPGGQGVLGPCLTQYETIHQQAMIGKYGCLHKSWLWQNTGQELANGSCFRVEGSNAMIFFLGKTETNYQNPPKLCRAQFGYPPNEMVTVCPSGAADYFLGVYSCAGSL